MVKQCIFVDEWKNIQRGFLLDDGNMLCACCGGIIEPENFRLLKVYDCWVKLDRGIADPVDWYKYQSEFRAMSDDEFYEWFDNC